jgi:hypothetical protein
MIAKKAHRSHDLVVRPSIGSDMGRKLQPTCCLEATNRRPFGAKDSHHADVR